MSSFSPSQLHDGSTAALLPFPSSCPQQQNFWPGPATANGRKRRAGLQPIDLSKCSPKKLLIGGSSESLNSADGAALDLESPTGSKDCLLSLAGTDSEGEENLKRSRLRSQSSSSSSDNGGGAEWCRSSTTDAQAAAAAPFFGPAVAKKVAPPSLNLAELEGDQEGNGGSGGGGSSSPRHQLLSSGGLVLVDDARGAQFELVGDGRNCKAVEMASQCVWHCQIVKTGEFAQIADIMGRMQNAASAYSVEEFEERSKMLLPLDQLRILRSPQRPGLVYILLPDHHGTLHQLLEESELNCPGAGPVRLGEARARPILKQVAALLEFCNRIGLYFRDFRLRKFVFTDSEKTRIRVNNILHLYLAPEVECDLVISREFIPAYVAPEMLDKKNDHYGGGAADVWAFGVLMFTLLNGRYPFFEPSPSPIALLRRIRAHRFTFPMLDSISAPARWLIHSLLCQSPADRPSARQLLRAHWFRMDEAETGDEKWLLAAAEHPIVSPAAQSERAAKLASPPNTTMAATALFLLSSAGIGPVSTAMNSSGGGRRGSPPAGQVPRISPIRMPTSENDGGQRRRLLSRHVRALVLDESVGGQRLLLQSTAGQRTASESRPTGAGGARVGQAPVFVPIGASGFGGDRRFGGPATSPGTMDRRRQMMMMMIRLMPLGLAMDSGGARMIGATTTATAHRETTTMATNRRGTEGGNGGGREKVVPSEAAGDDQIVPEWTAATIFNAAN